MYQISKVLEKKIQIDIQYFKGELHLSQNYQYLFEK